MASNPRTCCCPRTTRWRATGSPTRTTPTATTWPRVPTRTASGCPCRSTRTARSRTRTSARPPGRAACSVREFKGNVAHSNYDAFMFDRNITANNTFGVTGNMHIARENPDGLAQQDRGDGVRGSHRLQEPQWRLLGPRRDAHLQELEGGGQRHRLHAGVGLAGGASLADPYTSRVVDSLFVGETENIGNPTTDAEKAYGRSLPKPLLPDFPVRGYEYYDYRHDVVNTTFRNFEDNATRKTGATLLPAVHQLRRQLQQLHREGEVRERQAGVLPADDGQRPVGQRQWQQLGLQDRGDPRQGRLAGRRPQCLRCSSTTASTTASQPTRKPARSSPPGTPRCARAMSVA